MTARSEAFDLKKAVGSILVFVVMAIFIVWTLFPIYWAAISSVKSPTAKSGWADAAREADAEIAPFAARMSAEARARAVDAAFDRLTREAAGLPVLRADP